MNFQENLVLFSKINQIQEKDQLDIYLCQVTVIYKEIQYLNDSIQKSKNKSNSDETVIKTRKRLSFLYFFLILSCENQSFSLFSLIFKRNPYDNPYKSVFFIEKMKEFYFSFPTSIRSSKSLDLLLTLFNRIESETLFIEDKANPFIFSQCSYFVNRKVVSISLIEEMINELLLYEYNTIFLYGNIYLILWKYYYILLTYYHYTFSSSLKSNLPSDLITYINQLTNEIESNQNENHEKNNVLHYIHTFISLIKYKITVKNTEESIIILENTFFSVNSRKSSDFYMILSIKIGIELLFSAFLLKNYEKIKIFLDFSYDFIRKTVEKVDFPMDTSISFYLIDLLTLVSIGIHCEVVINNISIKESLWIMKKNEDFYLKVIFIYDYLTSTSQVNEKYKGNDKYCYFNPKRLEKYYDYVYLLINLSYKIIIFYLNKDKNEKKETFLYFLYKKIQISLFFFSEFLLDNEAYIKIIKQSLIKKICKKNKKNLNFSSISSLFLVYFSKESKEKDFPFTNYMKYIVNNYDFMGNSRKSQKNQKTILEKSQFSIKILEDLVRVACFCNDNEYKSVKSSINENLLITDFSIRSSFDYKLQFDFLTNLISQNEIFISISSSKKKKNKTNSQESIVNKDFYLNLFDFCVKIPFFKDIFWNILYKTSLFLGKDLRFQEIITIHKEISQYIDLSHPLFILLLADAYFYSKDYVKAYDSYENLIKIMNFHEKSEENPIFFDVSFVFLVFFKFSLSSFKTKRNKLGFEYMIKSASLSSNFLNNISQSLIDFLSEISLKITEFLKENSK